MKSLVQKAVEIYKRKFGGIEPVVVSAPGRVNLIGEHTDYNDGFVFPVAIDRYAVICGEKNNDGVIRMYSSMYDEILEYPVNGFKHDDTYGWANYILGVVRELILRGHKLPGANLVNLCTIPLGAGLSSSAAVEVATSTFFEKIANLDIPGTEVAKLCQRAENEFVGVKCGIMDQFISRLGKKGTALFIDCRSLEYEHVPFDNPSIQILVSNTGVKRGLVSSEYNTRRRECEEGVAVFAEELAHEGRNIKALRDVTSDDFRTIQAILPEKTGRRCRHVITENERVIAATDHLKSGDYSGFGRLLYDSHNSLRDDYEVSCGELDILVEILSRQKGVLGARMTGAGFGGCTVSVFEVSDENAKKQIIDRVSREYAEATGITSDIFFSPAVSGASVV